MARVAVNRTSKEWENKVLEMVAEGVPVKEISRRVREAGGPSSRETIYAILNRYGIDTGEAKRNRIRYERLRKDSAALARLALRHANGTVDKDTLVAAIGDWETKWKE